MRRALIKQWTNTSIARPSQLSPVRWRRYSHTSFKKQAKTSETASSSVHASLNEERSPVSKPLAQTDSLAVKQSAYRDPKRQRLSTRHPNAPGTRQTHDEQPHKFAEGKETGKKTSRGRFSLPKDQWDQESWSRLLDNVRTYRRHARPADAWNLYLSVMRNQLDMPTEGQEAAELWEHFIQTGAAKFKTSSMVATYAIELQKRTGTARSDWIYQIIVGNQLWQYPRQALKLHQLLKPHFTPDLEDFKTLLRVSLNAGEESVKIFRNIYCDHPVPNLYSTVVPKLCERNMQTQATHWHFLLVERNDLPKSFQDCKPLFLHHSHVKNDKVVEALAKSLIQMQVWYERDVDNFVQEDKFTSGEIMKRALAEAHRSSSTSLSDHFCARLFATKFFSVAVVINGLQIMSLKSMGPLALREMVARDNHDCKTVMEHIEMLRENGIFLQRCRFNKIIEKAVSAEQVELLKSMTSTDLHPDTFEDFDLQEELLAVYYKSGDRVQLERTLEAFRSSTPDSVWDIYRANLLLRCHISLRNRAQIVSALQSMQLNRYPLAPRSSRHLRTMYLSPRRGGEQPSNSRQAVKDIVLITNVMKMTLQSGEFIPIEAWKEILKRLGMMSQLNRYQSLALWLVRWYSRPTGPEAHRAALSNMHAVHSLSTTNQISTESAHPLKLLECDRPVMSQGNYQIQNRNLLKIFGKDAQQAMIAWGFQAELKQHPKVSATSRIHYADPRTHWQWGLRLLKTLQLCGLQVDKYAVARAFQQRLSQLFNATATSQRLINRRAKALNDERSKLGARFRYGAYIEGIEEIWGRDVLNRLADFEHDGTPLNVEPGQSSARLIRYTKLRRLIRN